MLKKYVYINGIKKNLLVNAESTLADVLRRQLGLTGTKIGCGQGQCGVCSVLMDGKVVRSCITKMGRVPEGAKITTIEGVGTPDKLHPIQKAWIKHGGAQCGFCSPGFIVSAKGLLDENPKPSREEVREWFQKHRNACRCTGYIPLVDAVMDAAKVLRGEMREADLEFKMPADGRIWGSYYPRPTAVGKVTGTLDYGADLGLKMPADTLHLALVQAKVSHAKIKGIDTSEAEKMPGVFKIVTHKDVKGKNRITGLITFPSNKGDGWDRPILCDEKVFQYGDAVAIVCATTYEHAVAAAEKVKLDLEVLPAYLSAPAAMAEDAIEIHPGTPNVYFEQILQKGGDTKPFFKDQNMVVAEESVISSRQPHMPMEPDVGFAYQGDDGKLYIHSKSIGVHLHLAMIAPGLGIDPDKLVLVANPMGGTFGYKFSPTMEALVGVAAMATGRPVFLGYNYEQQQQYTGKRSPFYITARFAAEKTGKIKAMEADFAVDHGPYSEFGDLLTLRGSQFIGAGYGIPNMWSSGKTVCTNHAWGAAFRAYGSPQSFLASELLMDRLAEKLNMDPLELRILNAYQKGDTNPSGQELDSYSLKPMLEAMRPKYKAALEKAKSGSTATHKRGVGISVGVYGCGLDGPDGSEVNVEVNPDDTITIEAAWGDHGQGADSGAIGTAHEALLPMKVAPQRLRHIWAATNYAVAGPAGGSRSQVMVGGAIRVACEALLAAAKKPDGSYMNYAELKTAGKPTRFNGKYSVPGVPCDDKAQGKPFMVYTYGVFMAEVCVELATGKTVVEKMTAHCDLGKINNRLVVDGQIWGGIAQGIGLALTEDFEDIKKHATLAGAGFPYIKDIPDNIEIEYFEYPREFGPFGAAGVGELPLTSPHASILNAITNACGAKVTRIPAYPERVLKALKK